MIVMVANVAGPEVRSLAEAYPGLLGNLLSPRPSWWSKPLDEYALDNGRFSQKERWSVSSLMELYGKAAALPTAPRWVLVPDIVGDWDATRREWEVWEPVLRQLGWPLAVAVQDGATPDTAAALGAEVIFVGGSTRFKWTTMAMWCSTFPRVHVGRVNSPRETWRCYQAGAESVDGTGWMRTTRQRKGLRRCLDALTTGVRPAPATLFGCQEVSA